MAETPAQRSARMKAFWAAKKAADEAAQQKQTSPQNKTTQKPLVDPDFGDIEPEQPDLSNVPQAPTIDQGDIARMVAELVEQRMASIQAAQSAQTAQWQPQTPGVQYGPQGLVGTREKYSIAKGYYPDPTERLASEPRLQRFAFKENYALKFDVSVSNYQTKDGVNTKEPKFTLELHRIMFDEDSGEATNQRYTVCNMIFHEDPEAALAIAQEQGLDVNAFGEADFLNEMRYLRMRDWLLEAFYPARPQASKRRKEMVINNRVVEVFEVNAESDQTMPFNEMNKSMRFKV